MKEKILQIINKIKNFLNKIFNSQKIKMIESSNNLLEKSPLLNTKVETNLQNKEVKSTGEKEKLKNVTNEEKKRIFELYQKVKDGSVELTSMQYEDLIKIKILLQEELRFQTRKVEEEEKENKILENEILYLNKKTSKNSD